MLGNVNAGNLELQRRAGEPANERNDNANRQGFSAFAGEGVAIGGGH